MKGNKLKAIQQTDTFWDKRSKRYDKNIKKHDSLYEKTIDSTKSLLSNSDVVLDFACASGEMSLEIAPHVKEVHGIDLSVKMIELANQKAYDLKVDNIKFNQIDVFDQSLESNSFSAILAFNIFHLLDDAPRVMARINDLLAQGGLLISQTPCLGQRGRFFKAMINLAKIWDEKFAVQWIVARKI